MGGELVAVIIGAVIVGACGLGFVALGRAMAAGRVDPNMGHHTAHNTTAESWRAMQRAVGTATATLGWVWVVAAVAFFVFVPAAVALLIASSLWLVVHVVRASALPEPLDR